MIFNLKKPSRKDLETIKRALVIHNNALIKEAIQICASDCADFCNPIESIQQDRLNDFEKRLDKLDFQVGINVAANRLLRTKVNEILVAMGKIFE